MNKMVQLCSANQLIINFMIMIKKIIIGALLLNSISSNAQVFFSEDFSSGLNSWTNVDDDSDPSIPGPNGSDYDLWYVSSQYASLVAGSDGAAAISHSNAPNGAVWVAMTPNNFLISPLIDLSGASASNLKLKFDAGSGQLAGGHEEHYAVYVTTSNIPASIITSTPIFEETLPTTSASAMESHVIDISSYAGQSVYITIRHYNCTNQFNLLFDNIIIEQVLDNNASIESLELNRYSLTNTNNTLDLNITNEGTVAITSITIDWNDGASNSSVITGLNIAPFTSDLVSHPVAISYPTVLEKTIDVTITEVNGVNDTDPIGNTANTQFNTISTHVNKNVVYEEGTGTWCQSCPGGAVMMETMLADHPDNFIAIAVHDNDPMAVQEYRDSSHYVSLPKFHADRVIKEQQIQFPEPPFLKLAQLEVPASLSIMATSAANSITINVTATFNTVFSAANFRLGAIIVEDDVTGTTSDYDQANVYSGGSYGPMGGYENLSDPVPASQMVYNHVGRALIGGYNGQANSVPATITDGQTVNYTFNYTVPSDNDISKTHVVLVLIDQTTGGIVHAVKSDITVGINELSSFSTEIYPNPSNGYLNIEFIGTNEDYVITMFDVTGKKVLTDEISNANGKTIKTINTKALKNGVYFVNVATNGVSTTTKVLVQ